MHAVRSEPRIHTYRPEVNRLPHRSFPIRRAASGNAHTTADAQIHSAADCPANSLTHNWKPPNGRDHQTPPAKYCCNRQANGRSFPSAPDRLRQPSAKRPAPANYPTPISPPPTNLDGVPETAPWYRAVRPDTESARRPPRNPATASQNHDWPETVPNRDSASVPLRAASPSHRHSFREYREHQPHLADAESSNRPAPLLPARSDRRFSTVGNSASPLRPTPYTSPPAPRCWTIRP